MSINFKLTLVAALLVSTAAPAFAAEGKNMKEVTSIVGYNVTEQQYLTGPKSEIYNTMDVNNDGGLTFKEYSSYSNLDNEYDAFARMDTDGNKMVSYVEYENFDNTGKGDTQFESQLHGKASVRGTNLKSRIIEEPNTYYVPVQPEVVDVQVVAPAAR